MPYQQNPVSVVKGDHIVKDVYLSDLAAWQSQGYEIYDPSEPHKTVIQNDTELLTVQKKKAKSTPVEPEQT